MISQVSYAHIRKSHKPEDPDFFWNIFADPRTTRLCDRDDPVYRIIVRQLQPGETSLYWGWADLSDQGTTQPFSMVYPRWILFKMCFPSGPKAAEEAGQGKSENLWVELHPDQENIFPKNNPG